MNTGDRVRYIHRDSGTGVTRGCYPPLGTLGTIVRIGFGSYTIHWDNGTEGNGIWRCESNRLKVIDGNCRNCTLDEECNNAIPCRKRTESEKHTFKIFSFDDNTFTF